MLSAGPVRRPPAAQHGSAIPQFRHPDRRFPSLQERGHDLRSFRTCVCSRAARPRDAAGAGAVRVAAAWQTVTGASRCRRRSGPDLRVKITEEYAALVARDAYFWAWPMVNIYNRRLAAAQSQPRWCARVRRFAAPINRLGMITDYVDPAERLVACPNQDVVYGLGVLALDRLAGGDPGAGFRRPLLGLPGGRPAHRQLRAARQDVRHQARLLPAGRAELEGRRCPRASPRCSAPRPTQASSCRASSRTTRPDDKRAVQAPLRQVVMYPLAEYDGTMKSIDWTQDPARARRRRSTRRK